MKMYLEASNKFQWSSWKLLLLTTSNLLKTKASAKKVLKASKMCECACALSMSVNALGFSEHVSPWLMPNIKALLNRIELVFLEGGRLKKRGFNGKGGLLLSERKYENICMHFLCNSIYGKCLV